MEDDMGEKREKPIVIKKDKSAASPVRKLGEPTQGPPPPKKK